MCNERREQGYALLAVLMAVFVGGSSLMLGAINNRQAIASKTEQELFRQMVYAKEALLAYAANTHILYQNLIGPGYLPCPDADNSGKPDVVTGSEDNPNGLCHSSNTLGRLPKYVVLPDGSEFRFSDHNSGIDQQFWYAVASENLRISPTTPPNNSSEDKVDGTADRLSLDGNSGFVALIIAPGEALGSQSRIGTGVQHYSNYLDGDNGSSGTNYFTSSDTPAEFNDRIIGITHDELMQYVGMSVANRVKQNLDQNYVGNGNDYPLCFFWSPLTYCPWTESNFRNSFTGDWVSAENWNSISGSFFYDGKTYQFLNRTVYYRDPPTAEPFLIFSNCPEMRFSLVVGGGITHPESKTCF